MKTSGPHDLPFLYNFRGFISSALLLLITGKIEMLKFDWPLICLRVVPTPQQAGTKRRGTHDQVFSR